MVTGPKIADIEHKIPWALPPSMIHGMQLAGRTYLLPLSPARGTAFARLAAVDHIGAGARCDMMYSVTIGK